VNFEATLGTWLEVILIILEKRTNTSQDHISNCKNMINNLAMVRAINSPAQLYPQYDAQVSLTV
jgi:hypothetical protein